MNAMANGFFRELKHYRLYEIAKELNISTDETKRLTGILKKYGIVKTVKSMKPEYEDLSKQDIILTDVLDAGADIEYVFDFVGVVIVEEYVFKCYPKYIFSTSQPINQLKQVLRVIQKYNAEEQLIYLYNGEGDNRIFNRLAVSLHLLEDYFQYGVYTNREIIEVNGEGEILWDKTINETFALIQKDRPYYLEFQTQNAVDDEMDYVKRLHECVLTKCTAELKNNGVLELFGIAEVELSSYEIDDFGDTDYIKYRLERELQTQFVTRKQILLKTLYTYIANEKTEREDRSFSLYGTNSFHLVWEKVCAENFGNMLHDTLSELPFSLSDEYKKKRDTKLIDIIERPIWHKNNPVVEDCRADTLKPDLIRIYPIENTGEYCFGIYDAKYYCINFRQTGRGYQVTGQPGIADVTKQYLYQAAYNDFILKQKCQYVQNVFLCPQEDAEAEYGYVEMQMLHTIADKRLENIAVVKLCAGEMYDIYLSGRKIENISDYVPKLLREEMQSETFSNRMIPYLQKISKASQTAMHKMQLESEGGKIIYPKIINRELGAKLIYDAICTVAVDVFYGFDPYKKEYDNLVAESAGNFDVKCNQIAEAALNMENIIKNLSEMEMENLNVVKAELVKCFEGMGEIASVAQGRSLDKLAEKMMELIKTVYL